MKNYAKFLLITSLVLSHVTLIGFWIITGDAAPDSVSLKATIWLAAATVVMCLEDEGAV